VLWRPFEIHPEVPPEGLPLSSLGYGPAQFTGMMEHLRRQGSAEGIDFAALTPDSLLVNTHFALAASAIVQAQAPERFGALHEGLFKAKFGEDRNIADAGVLRDIATAAGVDPDWLDDALDAGAGERFLREAARAADRHCITAVPAFVFGENRLIVGAQPTAALVRAAEQTAARS
jgi:predicted DsbA family dithiol-disulfide isomerase